MSIFDRFTSQKGKAEKAAPKPTDVKVAKKAKSKPVVDDKKDAFKAVPGATPAKTADKAEKKAAPAAVEVKATGDAHRVLLSAVVTEKSARIEKSGQYVFAVAADASKKTVAEAVNRVYGVNPVAVNIVRLPGKWVRYGRTVGRQVVRKKAIVTLPAGKSIDIVST